MKSEKRKERNMKPDVQTFYISGTLYNTYILHIISNPTPIPTLPTLSTRSKQWIQHQLSNFRKHNWPATGKLLLASHLSIATGRRRRKSRSGAHRESDADGWGSERRHSHPAEAEVWKEVAVPNLARKYSPPCACASLCAHVWATPIAHGPRAQPLPAQHLPCSLGTLGNDVPIEQYEQGVVSHCH